MKKIFSILFLFFALALIAVMTTQSAFAQAQGAVVTNVTYFYGPPRCITCKNMEAYTQSAVSKMQNKNVKYKGIDISKPENKQFIKKYGLYTKAVVLSKTVNGKEQWKNLDQIWTKAKNKDEFEKYIIKEIKEFQK